MKKSGLKNTMAEFFNELLLYSGQYALFYIIFNFSDSGILYFTDIGHTLLLFILVVQTLILVKWGSKPLIRFLGSLIAPLVYTLIEIPEGLEFILNTGHVFFWVFSVLIGVLQAIYLISAKQKTRIFLEFIITSINVLIFMFVYFVFDVNIKYEEQYTQGLINQHQYLDSLEVTNVLNGLADFLDDPVHIYLIFAGLLLSASLAIGRVKLLKLKDKINELFGKYVDKDFRDRIVLNEEGKSEKKEVCILFSDIRSFTSISEKYPPDKITQMLNYYFSEWDKTVTENNGIIDKYIGDAIMVLFGINDSTGACDNAVRSAEVMLKRLDDIKGFLLQNDMPVFENIGIGINFGEIIVGDIGSSSRKNYTVIGDNVNIASRLEHLCKKYKTPLIISESTYKNLSDPLSENFKPLGKVMLRGKSEAFKVYNKKQAV